ncbi:hypothetical protein LJB90_02575 [Eubacteriales bacterium OttesenSCG-928-G02]|nr:hypothetical protein [Eubacteriales bacterium OttesenSCG-928-G02]
MRILTLGERFKNYMDTFDYCGTDIINKPDLEIGYYVFEEFDTSIICCLYKDSLDLFKYEGLIDDEIAKKSKTLREEVLFLQSTSLWNIEAVKNSEEWLNIMKMCDEIKSLVHQRWTGTPLEELYSLSVYPESHNSCLFT